MSQQDLLTQVVKALEDALSVYEVQARSLDLHYIDHWLNVLDAVELWKRLRDEAEIV